MTVQTILVTLPEKIYRRLEQKSHQTKRSLADEAVVTMAESLPGDEQLPGAVVHELKQLQWLTDDELWQAARLTATDDEAEEMQILLERQQREGLTPSERQKTEQLSTFFNRIMLVRAEAAVLLKKRGHDITHLFDVA